MKYILLKDPKNVKTILGVPLYRIQYVRDVSWLVSGSLGGWIASEDCLSQEGESFVGGNAYVFPESKVLDNAKVYGRAWVQGKSILRGNGSAFDHAISTSLEPMPDLHK